MTLSPTASSPYPAVRYQPNHSVYDECVDEHGNIRPHWQDFANVIRDWQPSQFTQREEQLRRLIHDNGITYNVYSQPAGESRPWTMDMLPLIYGHQEWAQLGQALSQRAELLNLIYQDLYGPQTLLKEGLLPPALILGNPHFCRPCHDIQSTPRHALPLYAADLARSPDGNWWVLSDRLEASSGLGYALENRFLSSRIFPRLINQLGIQALQPFINSLCQSYQQLAPLNPQNPHIVFLTPGPANETYFEQSYLARHLGYTLVEGSDLTVRDKRVYLKTINGVKEVDVIIRRIDTPWCDPLELNSNSMLGVPGLVDVMRKGQVAIVNALGASLLETSAIPAFLPLLCRHFLGEELKIPSVATWWCGGDKERNYVLDNLSHLVLRPILRHGFGKSIFGPHLGQESLAKWKRRIQAHPESFCAQEMVAQATTPVYEGDRFHSRHFLLRSYCIHHQDHWQIMPGGLARIASSQDPINVSMQKGGESKDVWVLSPPASSSENLVEIASALPAPMRRSSLDLSSRVADNFFWLGRYLERTEGLTRVLQCILESFLDQNSDDDTSITCFFSYFLSKKELRSLISQKQLDSQQAEKKLALQIRDQRKPESLVCNFQYISQSSSRVKERLSHQTWQQLMYLHELTRAASAQRYVLGSESMQLLRDTLDLMASLSGLIMENMTRGQNWVFLELGRRLERSLVLNTLIQATLSQSYPNEEEVLRKLLHAADSSMTYRRRYGHQLHRETVLQLILNENSNPRSLAFQSTRIQECIAQLPHNAIPTPANPIDHTAQQLQQHIEQADPSQLFSNNAQGQRKELAKLCHNIHKDLIALADAIGKQYFAHTSNSDKQRPLQAI